MTRRETTKFATLALSMATLFSACTLPNDSHESNHAGVLTETESGHTIAFDLDNVSLLSDSKASAKVKFTLTKMADGKTVLFDSATVNYGDKAVFENANEAYSVLATAFIQHSKKEIDTLYGAEILRRNDHDNVYVTVAKPATLKISTNFVEEVWNGYDNVLEEVLSEGDTLCITGTLSCTQITEADIERGHAYINNIPIFGSNESGHYEKVKQLEIYNGNDPHIVAVDWYLNEGDTLFAHKEALIKESGLFSLDFTLPESDLFDTLGDHVLDSLIVPLIITDEKYDFLLDEHDNIVPHERSRRISSDSTLYWIVLPQIDSTAKLTAVNGSREHWSAGTRLYEYLHETVNDTISRWYGLFEDNSFAISFWFQLDSLTKDSILLGAGTDSLGFDIRRCEKDSTALCTRIYNGIDSASTDSVEYGKASVIDGKRHHYSLVIHKRHLTIAIDGVSVRDTDLKFSEDFYELKNFYVGSNTLQDLLHYSFGDYIKHKDDKNWTRLKAWLYAFYEMQKDI